MPATAVGLVRLVHPFPTLLNGLITAALAILAGGTTATAFRLAGSMVALQASIGSLNDVVDESRDAGRKLGKPIPGGLVSRRLAGLVAAVALLLGLSLAAMSGAPTLLAAVAGVGTGYAYDLWLKGTAASWLPFALGIPLLPVFAWVGVTGSVPAAFALLVPLGAVSGAALAIANALADHERDVAAGSPSVVTALGPRRAWAVHGVLQSVVVGGAVVALRLAGLEAWPALAAGMVVLAGSAIVSGGSPRRREVGWEVEAAGTGLLAVAWLAGMAGSTGPG
jgi:4-hydroxybenzoate polyprenyltransferase